MFAGTHAYFSMEENRTCSVNYFCFGAVLIFIGSILLCALGFTIVLPFESTKLWYKAPCMVISSEVNTTICACEEQVIGYPGCAQHYPCLQVYVSYMKRNNNITIVNDSGFMNDTSLLLESMPNSKVGSHSIIQSRGNHTSTVRGKRHVNFRHKSQLNKYDDNYNEHYGKERGEMKENLHKHEQLTTTSTTTLDKSNTGLSLETFEQGQYQQALLYRSWSDIFYTHCSLQECGDQEWNSKETRRFRMKYGRLGQKYDCYVNPENPHVVILNKTSLWAMLHAVLWPSTCLFVGVTLWIGLCCGCWKIDSENLDNSVPYYGVL